MNEFQINIDIQTCSSTHHTQSAILIETDLLFGVVVAAAIDAVEVAVVDVAVAINRQRYSSLMRYSPELCTQVHR